MLRRFPTLTRSLRTGLLVLVLGAAALVVPDSAVQPTGVELVRIKRAGGVSVGPDVVWILAVGSDARPGEDMLRSRGDALQLIGINTRTDAATAIGVPRDSWVSIPGHGMNKINASLYFGGPKGMAGAMANLTGITPDYVMVTRFPFFENMVDDIGGIEVRNPRRFTDPYLKKEGFRAGRIHLGGYDAMAFSRIRKSLAGGDFDRSANQQRTLRGIHARIRAQADRPGFIERGVMSVLRNMGTNLGPAELYQLAQAVAQVEPGKITTCVIGGRIGSVGGQSVVFPDVAQARRLGNAARADATLRGC
ncbi:LCP family protein [Nocardioides currus]|uniref:LytR family transcriptional regulator n=1 Tax=Nocardioides currus TaxID=2133958 RepID=A0A2R7YVP9_9ACTN|nr:LCP family protein [Nocardioides currus]PUA80487.1 LytR family transcriptional regulator [Nocardioides currus]